MSYERLQITFEMVLSKICPRRKLDNGDKKMKHMTLINLRALTKSKLPNKLLSCLCQFVSVFGTSTWIKNDSKLIRYLEILKEKMCHFPFKLSSPNLKGVYWSTIKITNKAVVVFVVPDRYLCDVYFNLIHKKSIGWKLEETCEGRKTILRVATITATPKWRLWWRVLS